MTNKKEESLSKEDLKTLNFLTKNSYKLTDIKQLINALQTQNSNKHSERIIGKEHFKFGLFGDNHIGNINYRPDIMKDFAKQTKKQKVDFVLNSGDIFDGWYQNRPSSIFEQNAIGFDQQMKKSVKELSQLEVPIYFITGNHCFHPDTEFLTEKGFLKINDIIGNNIKVGQFNKKRIISFAYPKEFIKNPEERELFKIETRSSCQIVTDNHRVLFNNKFVKANKLINYEIKESNIPVCGFQKETKLKISNDWIRLLTWVVADATIVNHSKYIPNSKKIRIQFKLSKERKITTLVNLLNKMNIPYTFKECKKTGLNKLQPYYIRIYSNFAREIYKLLEGVKQFPSWFNEMNYNQFEIFKDCLSITDGHAYSDRYMYFYTTNMSDANLIQELACKNNYSCILNVNSSKSEFKSNKTQYRLRISKKEVIKDNVGIIEQVESIKGTVCMNMPLGTLITRINGKIAFTGNSYNTFVRCAGVEAGPYLEDKLKGKGLEAKYLGNAEGDVYVGKTLIRLLHPDGGTAYALSYKPQKIAESLESGKKPNILGIGHFHKMDYLFYRNIHIFQTATLCGQTKFMKGKGLAAMLGYWIVDAFTKKSGQVDKLIIQPFPFYK